LWLATYATIVSSERKDLNEKDNSNNIVFSCLIFVFLRKAIQNMYCFIVLYFILGASLTIGQESVWEVYHSSINGIPDNNIGAVYEDEYGILWLGAGGYLVKFDGNYWKVFSDFSLYANEKIVDIESDFLSNLWFVTGDALYKVEAGYQITRIDSSELREISGLIIDYDNNKWISSANGLYLYDGSQFQKYDQSNSELNTYIIRDIYFKDGAIYLATSQYYTGNPMDPIAHGGGVVIIDNHGWQTYTKTSGLPSNSINKITTDAQGYVWCSTMNQLWKYDGENWGAYNPPSTPLPGLSISTLIPDPVNGIWVGTASGVIKVNDDDWTLFDTNNSELVSDHIRSLFIQNDRLSIGTDRGISIKTDEDWASFNKNNTAPPYGIIRDLSIDRNGDLWVGAEGGVSKFDGLTWQTFEIKGQISSLQFDSQYNLWLTTFNSYMEGISVYNNVEWKVYSMHNSGLNTEHVYDLAIDSKGNKWFATYPRWEYLQLVGGGLVKFDDISWEVYTTENSDLTTNKLTAIAIDDNDTKWIGTAGEGLIKIESDKYSIYKRDNSGLSYDYISCLEIDKKGDLWIGTGYGISVFDGDNWKTFTNRNSPLPSNYIYSISFEDNNTAWIATNSDGTAQQYEPLGGLVKYDGESWEVFTHENSGLPHIKTRFIQLL